MMKKLSNKKRKRLQTSNLSGLRKPLKYINNIFEYIIVDFNFYK